MKHITINFLKTYFKKVNRSKKLRKLRIIRRERQAFKEYLSPLSEICYDKSLAKSGGYFNEPYIPLDRCYLMPYHLTAEERTQLLIIAKEILEDKTSEQLFKKDKNEKTN